MARFFVPNDQISDKTIRIIGSDVNHIKNVLRSSVGEKLELFDSEGFSYVAIIENLFPTMIDCRMQEKFRKEVEPKIDITLAQSLPKGKKFDFILQKGTELGIKEIVPIISERSIPKIEEKEEKKNLHWQKIARESSEQCGRTYIPSIGKISSFRNFVETARDFDLKIIPYEGEIALKLRDLLSSPDKLSFKKIAILIGPEGGFAKEEVDLAIINGFFPITLGKRILRVETAAITAVAQVMYELD